ncbi:MAG: class I SAM-dependent methyltransferase, partial [Pseudomonadota bacterium]|nr:class I SAM-dependent methyltransferase [Pseudomonadota bacterium]
LHTFKFLFPRINETGFYVIEDTQNSYWRSSGGSSDDLNSPDTSMGFLKQLVDGLNHVEYEKQDYVPNYFDLHIVAMHFYHNIVFIQKGLNNEGKTRQ